MKAQYIVWNNERNEGFVTTNYGDAVTASTGQRGGMTSTLAERFFELYGDEGELEIEKKI